MLPNPGPAIPRRRLSIATGPQLLMDGEPAISIIKRGPALGLFRRRRLGAHIASSRGRGAGEASTKAIRARLYTNNDGNPDPETRIPWADRDTVMKSLVASALVLAGLGWATAPTMADCEQIPCFRDFRHLQGSMGRLISKCRDGEFAKFSAVKVQERLLLPSRQCGSRVSWTAIGFSTSDFGPVCSCVLAAAVPKHCDSIPCHHELLQMSDSSVTQLRKSCMWNYFSEARTIPLKDVKFTPTCGTASGGLLHVSPAEAAPVCECMTADGVNDYTRPESTDVMRGDVDHVIQVDVFVHVVVRSMQSARAKLVRGSPPFPCSLPHVLPSRQAATYAELSSRIRATSRPSSPVCWPTTRPEASGWWSSRSTSPSTPGGRRARTTRGCDRPSTRATTETSTGT